MTYLELNAIKLSSAYTDTTNVSHLSRFLLVSRSIVKVVTTFRPATDPSRLPEALRDGAVPIFTNISADRYAVKPNGNPRARGGVL